MTQPRSFVRPATLTDILNVVCRMRTTMRGQNELKFFSLVAGPDIDDRFLVQLWQFSHDTVALVANDDPGRALVVAGFISQRTGVSRTWMLATDEAWEGYGRELTVYTERGIAIQLSGTASRLHRVETICPDSHNMAKAWYPRLGLKQETTLAKFCTDGSDAALFVRLRGDT